MNDDSISEEYSEKIRNLNRVMSIIISEAEYHIKSGHTTRLEQCISRLHLFYTKLGNDTRFGWTSSSEMTNILQKISETLSKCFEVGTNDVNAPIVSDTPTAIVCSYPRSGNTMLVHLAASVMPCQTLENMAGSIIPFSKRIYARHYPYARLIKDHVARPMYRDDRVAFVVRDGRDTMISLAYMTYKQGFHNFSRRDQLADFISWLDASYPFGGWATHMRDMAALRGGAGDKLILRYEDIVQSHQPFIDFIRFLDPEHGLDDALLIRAHQARAEIMEDVKNNPSANQTWGIGAQFGSDSLFRDWSQNRGGSSWQSTWDAAARKRFHETGATDFLMEYGYESDQDWWMN